MMRALNLLSSIGVLIAMMVLFHRLRITPPLATVAACCLVLVPQWSAIMTMGGNDAPATLLSTIACVLLVRIASGDRSSRAAALAGVAVGFALSTKLTTWFLVPMAACAVLAPGVGPMRRRTVVILSGTIALAGGWVPLRNILVFGDPTASAFKREILERSGFLALSAAQPAAGTPAFWTMLRSQVLEAFWARFGSLGVGPDAASRLWTVYAAVTVLIVIALIAGVFYAIRLARARDERDWRPLTLAVGAATGLAAWIWINLAARPDTIVHWTPRHVLPLSAPLVALAALGAQRLSNTVARPTITRLGASVILVVLAGAWLSTLRHVIQQFYFGY
jgi:hypothetical protein